MNPVLVSFGIYCCFLSQLIPLGHFKKSSFEETKEAEIFFRNVSQVRIEEYLRKNKKDVLMSVGSYRIEDNKKYNFLKILKGDHETIIGFPLKNLKSKFLEDAK